MGFADGIPLKELRRIDRWWFGFWISVGLIAVLVAISPLWQR